MRAWLGLLCSLGPLLLSGPAATQECNVVLLRPARPELEAWVAGLQAVVAELSTGGCEVVVRSTAATNLDLLLDELAAAAASPAAVGAVTVVRQGPMGVAYVASPRGLDRAEADMVGGAVAEGAVALRVVQLLRMRTLSIPLPAEEEARPAPPPPATRHDADDAKLGIVPWMGAGTTVGAQRSSIPLAVLFGVRLQLGERLGIDSTVTASVLSSALATDAGEVSLDWWQWTGHAMFELLASQSFGLAVGLGGGLVWAREEASASRGFVAQSDAATVSVLSARAAASWEAGDLVLLAMAEPGLLVPALSVRAAGEEVVRVGRPWIQIAGGVGWAF